MKKITSIIIAFFHNRLILAHFGDVKMQMFNAFYVAIFLSPITYIIESVTHWTYTNQDYISWVVLAIALDHAFGTFNHAFISKDFSWKENVKGLITKSASAFFGGMAFEGLAHFLGTDSMLQSYVILVLRLAVFMYPTNSLIDNIFIFSGGKFPPSAFMNWKKKFNKDFSLPDKEGFKKEESNE